MWTPLHLILLYCRTSWSVQTHSEQNHTALQFNQRCTKNRPCNSETQDREKCPVHWLPVLVNWVYCIALNRYPDPFHSRLCRLGQQDCEIVGVCAKPQCASSAKSSSLVQRQHKTTYLAKRLFTGCSHCKRTETYTGLVGLCWDGSGGSRIKFPFNRRFRTFAHLQPFSLFPAILPSPSLY